MPTFKAFGSGPEKVLVMHNWFSDNSSYAPMLPYLDPSRYTFLFMDLRGYGSSKEVLGKFNLAECTADALMVADKMQWQKFHIMGHSMSSMIAQKIAVEQPSRVQSLVGISPVLPSGEPKTPALMQLLEEAAIANDDTALECFHILTNRRYSDYVGKKMVETWKNCSTSQARMAYLHMFSHSNFAKSAHNLRTPMLLVFGEHDFQKEDTQNAFLKLYPNARVVSCKNAGHFPVQETPMYLASIAEEFLNKYKTSN